MEALRPDLFVPDLPTLWPGMLLARPQTPAWLPFSAANVQYFYFARNALWLAVKAMGLEHGEILMPSYHHGVEVEAVIDAGASPRFYRVGRKWDVDLEDVKRRINPRTRALYLTHYAGFPGPAEEMAKLAKEHGLLFIEDCALSLLSRDGARPLGSLGDAAIFCLYKTLPVPNGGALVINGERRYSLPRPPSPPLASVVSHTASALLKNFELRGGSAGKWFRSGLRALAHQTIEAANVERVATGTQHFDRRHVDLGMSRLTLRVAQGLDLEQIVERRRRNYFFLLGRLRDVSPPHFSELPSGVCPLFYPLVVERKAEVMARLLELGVHSVDFWSAFHPSCDANAFPDVAMLRKSILEIPCHQDLSPEVMEQVAVAVRTALSDTHRSRPKSANG